MQRYTPKDIERKWQKTWDEQGIYQANLNSGRRKYIAMSMFNYPSGAGIHIGHAMNYTISDVMARFKRQQGYESYHPVGWDSFGLPAENYAIKTGITPQASMAKIIPGYHKQYKAMGWSNDWSKEVASHTPEYYKWSQWLFVQMHKNELAYQDSRMQWWCDKCQTVLANEQVIDGKCWRHDGADDPEVTKREVKQWFFKITDYADEILQATDALDWSEVVKTAQKNWIGKSQGAEIDFKVKGTNDSVKVFTTRPDTIFGATFIVLSPEHPIVSALTTKGNKKPVDEYLKQAAKKSEIERVSDTKGKTGVFTGSYAVNPANNEEIPIWIADYVLYGYGTGAIMAVPAHDERDKEFAQMANLPIVEVVAPDFGDPLPDPVDVTGPVVVGYDPKTRRYMSLINTKNGMRWFAAGGLEDGEDYKKAAYRELSEEAGFRKVKQMIQLGGPNYSYFYNPNKDSNRRSFSYMFLAIIDEADQDEQQLESHEKYRVEWSDFDTIMRDLEDTPNGRGHWIDGMNRAKVAVAAYHDGQEYEQPVYTDEGVLFNSANYTGMSSSDAREKIVADLESKGVAKEKTTFKIRDWSVSRQRYWGAPIPIINCPEHGPVLVPEAQLPVILPELDDFAPSGDGRSALARATDWLNVKCPVCGGPAERETDTMDTYICSSWYFLRYLDPHNTDKIFDTEVANKWMPIDFYNGGDHATAHMIYARFITRFLNKIGLVDNPEPFKKFLFNGKVTASDGTMFSKSKGNGVDPLEIINSGYGADSLRTYLMFAAPLDLWMRWDPQGVPGTYRFLNRIWNLTQEFIESTDGDGKSEAPLKIIHPTIMKVTHDLEEQKYNTAIAAMMKAVNELYELKAKSGFVGRDAWQFAIESLIMLVAPFAPHMAEELWYQTDHVGSVNVDNWPQWDDKYLQSDTVTVIVQVNGKLRARLQVAPDTSEEKIKKLALANDNVKVFIGDKKPSKIIYVRNKLVSIVV
ncbi:class I tRNA ligase family protein [Candidatus Saccharibacteria bacterium]|nr:class I tRNA ligase family protein [Candidatus Saccharibacteria bacterium]